MTVEREKNRQDYLLKADAARNEVLRYHYSAADTGAEYCDERVCVCVRVRVRARARACVCLSVLDHIFGTTRPIFTKFLCMLPMAVSWPSSGGVVTRYVLPVLWMTSYLLISQGCSTSPPSLSAVHAQPWACL